MAREPHFAHAALAQELDELIAAQGARLAELAPEPVHHLRRHHGEQRADVIRIEHQQRVDGRRHRQAAQVGDPDAEWVHRRGDQAAASILAGRAGASMPKNRISTVMPDSGRMSSAARPSC